MFTMTQPRTFEARSGRDALVSALWERLMRVKTNTAKR
jgi:hypothetical protein